MTKLLTVIAAVSYAVTCMQLLCYRRGYANYRVHIALVAWLLIAFAENFHMEILFGAAHSSLGQTGIALTLCVLVYRAEGNVANIIRGME
jgi:hypothetical protein